MTSLKRQLILTLIVLGLVPLSLSLVLNLVFTERNLLKSKREELRNFSMEVKRQVSSALTSISLSMGSISSNTILSDPNRSLDDKKKEFARLAKYVQHFCLNPSLLSTDGHVLLSIEADSALEPDRTEWFMKAMSTGATVIARPEIEVSDAQSLRDPTMKIQVYQPVKDTQGRVVLMVKAAMSFEKISEILSGAQLGESGSFVLMDDLGNILCHPNPEMLFQNYIKRTGKDFNHVHGGEFTTEGGEEMLFETQRLSKSETFTDRTWILLARVKKSEAMATASQYRFTLYGIAGLSLAITAMVGTWLASKISGPVIKTSAAARAVAAGELHTKLDGRGFREMAELADAFNHMTYQVLQHNEKLELMVDTRTRNLIESERELRATAAQLRAAYDSTREGILVLDKQGRVLTSNRHIERLFGLSAGQLQTSTPAEIQASICARFGDKDGFSAAWNETLSDEDFVRESEWELAAPNERYLSIYTAPVVQADGAPIARLWMFHDVTEQRLLEESVRHAHKMDAVGRLAGGVAHDFNNLLQGILGNLFMVQQDAQVKSSEEARNCLHAARNAGLRAAELVKGLLGFSRQSHLRLGFCNVNDVLIEAEALVKHSRDPRVVLTMDLQSDLWGLHADGNQIEQVVINLLVNACDAMPQGGNLMLTTRNIVIAPECIDLMPGAEPGEYVRITVSDGGVGMSEDVRSKIFEPFFTTKEQGKGTGLGLATSFGIIQQHGGWITCDSVLGHGTTFHILLPRNETSRPTTMNTPEAPKPAGGQETILVVDDELVVRAVAEAILRKHGYNVLSAADGSEALDILAREDGLINLVLMDMTMPRLSGMDTFIHMRKGLAPNVPVVICSGYLVDLSGFAAEAGTVSEGFLQKPYDVEDMARTVRKVLDEVAQRKAVPHE